MQPLKRNAAWLATGWRAWPGLPLCPAGKGSAWRAGRAFEAVREGARGSGAASPGQSRACRFIGPPMPGQCRVRGGRHGRNPRWPRRTVPARPSLRCGRSKLPRRRDRAGSPRCNRRSLPRAAGARRLRQQRSRGARRSNSRRQQPGRCPTLLSPGLGRSRCRGRFPVLRSRAGGPAGTSGRAGAGAALPRRRAPWHIRAGPALGSDDSDLVIGPDPADSDRDAQDENDEAVESLLAADPLLALVQQVAAEVVELPLQVDGAGEPSSPRASSAMTVAPAAKAAVAVTVRMADRTVRAIRLAGAKGVRAAAGNPFLQRGPGLSFRAIRASRVVVGTSLPE